MERLDNTPVINNLLPTKNPISTSFYLSVFREPLVEYIAMSEKRAYSSPAEGRHNITDDPELSHAFSVYDAA